MRKQRETLLTVEEVAEWLRVEPKTVYNWRSLGEGPRGTRIGRRVLFRESVVEEWLHAHENPKA